MENDMDKDSVSKRIENLKEKAAESEQAFRDIIRKVAERSSNPLAVWKVVARNVDGNKSVEVVFLLPGYSKSQVNNYLYSFGWDVSAVIYYAHVNDALKDSNDPNTLKIKGMPVTGNA